MTSTFTSLQPPRHKVEDRGMRLDPKVPTLAGAFSVQGFLSAGFVTHIYVSSLFGLDSGFDEFRELSIDWNFREGKQVRVDRLFEYAFPWLTRHRDLPFFLYLHVFDPHWDYEPPPPYATRYTQPGYKGPANGAWSYISKFLPLDKQMAPADLAQVTALYDGEISWTDAQLQRLFDFLQAKGLWDSTLLVILSDHGEELQDHGSVHHINTLYEELLHVPLIIKLPNGRQKGMRARVHERVRNIDIAPTILELMQLDVPDTFSGESLVPLFTHEGDDREVFARTVRHNSKLITLIEGDYKLIHSYSRPDEPDELYDLKNDPREQTNLAPLEPQRASEMRSKARAQMTAMSSGKQAHATVNEGLTKEQIEHLKALGYME